MSTVVVAAFAALEPWQEGQNQVSTLLQKRHLLPSGFSDDPRAHSNH